jgi:hypothetical protein
MTHENPLNPIDDDWIDRIVDGALTPAQLRAAIDRLDRQPDGWKRCALAFLEVQCWSEAFRALAESARSHPAIAMPSLPTVEGPKVRSMGRWRRRFLVAGVAAASFLLGWLVHPERPSAPIAEPTRPTARAIPIAQDVSEPPPGTPGVVDPSWPTDVLAGTPRDDRSTTMPGDAIVAVARLRIGDDGATAEVPILAGPGIDEEWLRDQPPPLTEYAQALWQGRGYEVDQRRCILTTTLADGRLVTVPIDQVEFHYTGHNPL